MPRSLRLSEPSRCLARRASQIRPRPPPPSRPWAPCAARTETLEVAPRGSVARAPPRRRRPASLPPVSAAAGACRRAVAAPSRATQRALPSLSSSDTPRAVSQPPRPPLPPPPRPQVRAVPRPREGRRPQAGPEPRRPLRPQDRPGGGLLLLQGKQGEGDHLGGGAFSRRLELPFSRFLELPKQKTANQSRLAHRRPPQRHGNLCRTRSTSTCSTPRSTSPGRRWSLRG